jgi:hypothetical protein
MAKAHNQAVDAVRRHGLAVLFGNGLVHVAAQHPQLMHGMGGADFVQQTVNLDTCDVVQHLLHLLFDGVERHFARPARPKRAGVSMIAQASIPEWKAKYFFHHCRHFLISNIVLWTDLQRLV